MNLIIEEYLCYNASEILPLYESAGWIAYTQSPDLLARAFASSLLTLAARDGEKLIGLLRAVGDGETIVFIQDILVSPEYRRKGIGSTLLKEIMNRYAHVRQIQLTADDDPELAAFYQSQGFRALSDLRCIAYSK